MGKIINKSDIRVMHHQCRSFKGGYFRDFNLCCGDDGNFGGITYGIIRLGKYVYIGISRCSTYDQYNRKFGASMAQARVLETISKFEDSPYDTDVLIEGRYIMGIKITFDDFIKKYVNSISWTPIRSIIHYMGNLDNMEFHLDKIHTGDLIDIINETIYAITEIINEDEKIVL